MLTRLSAPLSVFLAVTNDCNLKCSYCSAEAGTPYPDELSEEEMNSLIDELASARVFSLTVTGGEPFLRKNIFSLLERLRRHRIVTSIISNGTLINDRIADQLLDLGINDVNISLDATSSEANDACRGPAAFRRAYRGIKILLAHKIRPGVLVTTTSINFRLAPATVKDLRALNVKFVAFNAVSAVGRGACIYSALALSPPQLSELAAMLRRLKSSYPGFIKEDLLHWYELPARTEDYMERQSRKGAISSKTLLPCGAAKTACAITADGWVIPCNKLSNYHCGNIRKSKFLEIWNNEKMDAFRRLSAKPTHESAGCMSCRYNRVCAGGCRAEALLHYGSLEAPDPACHLLADSAGRSRHVQLIQISGLEGVAAEG